MKKVTLNNKSDIINIITLVCVTAFMLFLNFNCGYISDDFHFKFVWTDFDPQSQNEPVDSLSDIIVSMQNYYNLSGGRVLCHFIIYCLLTVDKAFFNILNSLMFTLLGLLSYIYIRKKSKLDHFMLLPVIYITYLLFLPSIGDNCIWLSGSVNYHWSTVLLLLCFIKINSYAENASASFSVKELILLCILIFLSSLTNETTGGMLILFMLITFILEYRFKAVNLIPFIPAVIGTLFVISAPGNVNRSIKINNAKLFSFSDVLSSLSQYLNYTFDNYYIGIVLVVFALILSLKAHKKIREILIENKLFISGFAGIAVLSMLGFFSLRPIFLGAVPMIASFAIKTINLYTVISDKLKKSDQKGSLICKLTIDLYISICAGVILATVFCINKYDIVTFFVEIIDFGLLTYLICLVIKKSHQNRKIYLELKRLYSKIKRISKIIPMIIIIASLIPISINSIKYIQATEERNEWFKESEQAIIDGYYETILYKPYQENDGGIYFPQQSTYCDVTPYTIGWRAADMGINIYTYPYN